MKSRSISRKRRPLKTRAKKEKVKSPQGRERMKKKRSQLRRLRSITHSLSPLAERTPKLRAWRSIKNSTKSETSS